jgi:flagellar assembly protein FliH
MYSSKIYKSGVNVQIDDLVLEQLYSPKAMKELLAIEKVYEGKKEEERVEDDSKDKLLKIEKDAYEKGFQVGEKAGLEVASNKADVIIGRIKSIYEEMKNFKEEYYKENEAEILALIMAAATKVVHTEIKTNEEAVLIILTDAVKAMTETENVQIRLNPDDILYLRENNPDFVAYLEEAKAYTIFADTELNRAEVLIESNHCEIDARIESGIKNIEKATREALSSEPETD